MVDLVAQLITEITELSAIDFNISKDKNDKNLASLAFNKLIVSNFLYFLDDFFMICIHFFSTIYLGTYIKMVCTNRKAKGYRLPVKFRHFKSGWI